jgi:hypothetical protein
VLSAAIWWFVAPMWPQRSRLGRCVGALRSAAMDGLVATPAASSIAAAPRVATTAPAAAAPVVPGSILAVVGCTTCPAHEEGDAPAMSAGGAHGVGAAAISRRQGNPADGQQDDGDGGEAVHRTPPHDADDGCRTSMIAG